MPKKYTKAIAVTPNDSTDLTTNADAVYVGGGCYTDGVDDLDSSITTDAGEPIAWFRADDSTGNSQDNRGSDTTSAIRQTTASEVPPVSVAVNEKVAIVFDGSNQYMSVADSTPYRLSDTDFSLVIVFKLDNVTNEQFIWCKDNLNSDWGLYMDRHGYINFKTLDFPDLQSPSIISADTWYVVEVTRVGDDGYLYLNGSLVDSETDAFDTFDADLGDTMYFACRQGTSSLSRFLNGDIAEAIMWAGDNKLSSGDRTRLMSYLNDRYFNTPQFADVSMIAKGNTSAISTDRLERGVVHPLNISRIRSTGTNGSSIIALYE